MKKNASLLVLAVVVGAGAANARSTTPFHQKVVEQSERAALGAARMKVLQRRPGIGREAAVRKVLAKLDSEGLAKSSSSDRQSSDTDALLLESADWRLQSRGTGDWVFFENVAHARGLSLAAGRPVTQKPTLDRLEGPARQFIERALSDIVRLAPNETLQPWGISHQGLRVGDGSGGPEQEAIVATKIGFTRAIDGVAVLGSGSKIDITFDVNGRVVSFNVDWPEYAPLLINGKSAVEATVDLATTRQRGLKLQKTRGFAKLLETRPLECGYYDPGALTSTPSGVRGACQSRYVTAGPDGLTRAAFIDTIPIGEQVVNDAAWPESVLLRQ
jgi:hypothetical protein